MTQITHTTDESGRLRQIVTPATLRQILLDSGETLARPRGLGPGDEWDVDDDAEEAILDESPDARLERARNACFYRRGCELEQVYVCIPHQLPAFIRDAADYPPVEEDGDHSIRGDHDWHGCVSVESALTWRGHQWAKVQTLAERLVFELSR